MIVVYWGSLPASEAHPSQHLDSSLLSSPLGSNGRGAYVRVWVQWWGHSCHKTTPLFVLVRVLRPDLCICWSSILIMLDCFALTDIHCPLTSARNFLLLAVEHRLHKFFFQFVASFFWQFLACHQVMSWVLEHESLLLAALVGVLLYVERRVYVYDLVL